MAKRPSVAEGPPAKKVHFEPVQLGAVSTLEEMDMRTLHFQNRKLAQRLEQRHRHEQELRGRIEHLEKRQQSDEGVLTTVNRYWNQLNEDLRILLQRFDAETADEIEKENEDAATTSFMATLAQWDKEELEERLGQRVLVSTRAVSKLLQAFDRLMQRNHKIMEALNGKQATASLLEKSVRALNQELIDENARLQAVITRLSEKDHCAELRHSALQDRADSLETKNDELNNKVEELEYELHKSWARSEKLDTSLSDCLQRLKAQSMPAGMGDKGAGDLASKGCLSVEVYKGSSKDSCQGPSETLTSVRVEELQSLLEEQRELAQGRIQELEQLNEEHKVALRTIEQLKMDLQYLPEHVVRETTEYKCLQSQFSVLYNESMQLQTQLEEYRQQLQGARLSHQRTIERMESEELAMQKKLRTEVIRLEDALAQVRKEYEKLRIEFEQNVTASEQAAPLTREMRNLLQTLQAHNRQVKGETARYKRKLKESTLEVARLRAELNSQGHHLVTSSCENLSLGGEPSEATSSGAEQSSSGSTRDNSAPSVERQRQHGDDTVEIMLDLEVCSPASPHNAQELERDKGKSDAEIVRELRSQLKKAEEDKKELKLLLDTYKQVPKETRDKVTLLAAEKRALSEVDQMKEQLRKLIEAERKERRKLADEEALGKIQALEEQVAQLKQGIASQKQEEDALLQEMELTGQAFEDMQEQNQRLIQQLKEKDDANFKLMSERIKASQMQKLLKEEKLMLQEQVNTLQSQVEAQNQVVRKLEEKERLLQAQLSTAEKELNLRQTCMELHKRKALESAQSAADLKLHLEKYLGQLKDAQTAVTDKAGAYRDEAFKSRRLQEEIMSLKRKLERAKKFELATNSDEVLLEEIREYKETLTCPSCKVKKKDAVLTKCYHVFCYDCLKTRYETRQRKCPKCNATFGANDYHRLYLS
ncbi:E3 ubiquitin-protein ligase Bre1-like isoform X3 [Varroa destructor]|nr:E3 ubiquitin-protein ligase Bre1-like isoform X3 [Varroa destructor]XP_022666986.1 E3 ubiquitin-protein ligase Bre1-like isoform X3 [Varroa destructor]